MKIISVRENPEYKDLAIAYFQEKWADGKNRMIYKDCIDSCIGSPSPLPQWYLLREGEETAGCAGLITNDFISRMDLWPWLCALYVEERFRGSFLSSLLVGRAREDAEKLGFKKLYLCTDHVGFYEKLDFRFIGTGYHPWGGSSRIYETDANV